MSTAQDGEFLIDSKIYEILMCLGFSFRNFKATEGLSTKIFCIKCIPRTKETMIYVVMMVL